MIALDEVRTEWQTRRRSSHLHNRGNHADVHHDPAKGEADPVLAKVHRQSVGEQTAGHTTDREPDTMQTELSSPVVAVPSVDPFIEEVSEDPA